MKRLLSLLLTVLCLVSCLLITACNGNPEDDPDNEESTVTESDAAKIIENAASVLAESGAGVIKDTVASITDLECAAGALSGVITFDKNTIPSVYFADSAVVLDNGGSDGAMSAYALAGNTLLELSGNRFEKTWELTKQSDLGDYFAYSESTAAQLLSMLGSMDLSDITAADITKDGEYFYLSDTYIEKSLKAFLLSADVQIDAEQAELLLSELSIKPGFAVRRTGIYAIKLDIGADSLSYFDMKGFSLKFDCEIDPLTNDLYYFSFETKCTAIGESELNSALSLASVYNESANITGINFTFSLDGVLPFLTVKHDDGEQMALNARVLADISGVLDGGQILSQNGTVFDFNLNFKMDSPTFAYYDALGNPITDGTAFTDSERKDALEAYVDRSYSLEIKAVNNAVKQGTVKIKIVDDMITTTTVGDIKYGRPEAYPAGDALDGILKELRSDGASK